MSDALVDYLHPQAALTGLKHDADGSGTRAYKES